MSSHHGLAIEEPPADVWLGPDPDLALVHADMHAWSEAHPCDCEALCVCDGQELEVPSTSAVGWVVVAFLVSVSVSAAVGWWLT